MIRWGALVLLAAALALALRLPELDRRPMHNDEAVNAVKFGELWERGTYQYDPHEYHGPALHYLTAAFCRLTGAPDFNHLSETRLRWVTVLAGVGLVLLLALIRDDLGRGAAVAAAFFTALSPALVFYSRYWIHELLLVLFTFLAFSSAWRFWQRPSWAWAAVAGLGFGLMHATKETFVFAVAAALGALTLNWLWLRFIGARPAWPRLPWRMILLAVAVWLLVWVAFFTSFLTHAGGLVDSCTTYRHWLGHAGEGSLHVQPWSFYWERLFWFRRPNGPFWSEGMLLLLGVVGAGAGFRRKPHTDGDGQLIRLLAFFTVLLALIYSGIPYKTPWCVLGFLHGLILLAGVGTAVLWRAAGTRFATKLAVAGALVLGAAHLGWQAWRASFPLCAARSNPWVYAQTSPDLLNLVEQVREVARAGQGPATFIQVISESGDCWPLPWYLRDFTRVGWWSENEVEAMAPLVIHSATLAPRFKAGQTNVSAGYFELRPGVFLELQVERGLWEKSLQRSGSRLSGP